MRYKFFSKHNKHNNMKNYDKDKRELIFMGGLKGETLENVIDYWNVMNNNNTLLISVIDNPKVKEAIDIIKKELSKKPE